MIDRMTSLAIRVRSLAPTSTGNLASTRTPTRLTSWFPPSSVLLTHIRRLEQPEVDMHEMGFCSTLFFHQHLWNGLSHAVLLDACVSAFLLEYVQLNAMLGVLEQLRCAFISLDQLSQ